MEVEKLIQRKEKVLDGTAFAILGRTQQFQDFRDRGVVFRPDLLPKLRGPVEWLVAEKLWELERFPDERGSRESSLLPGKF